MANTSDIVTFLNSRGEEVSNDPRWLAKQTLEAAGYQTSAPVSSALVQENEALKAELAALRAQSAAQQGVEDDDDDDDDIDDDFQKMNGKELQAYAKENGHDIKGLKTVGEVRARLRELTSDGE